MPFDCVDFKTLVMTLYYIVNLYGSSLFIDHGLLGFEAVWRRAYCYSFYKPLVSCFLIYKFVYLILLFFSQIEVFIFPLKFSYNDDEYQQ